MILMLAPAAGMVFGAAPSGAAYVADQFGLVKVTNNNVADQTFLQTAGCFTLTPFGGWGTFGFQTLTDLYAADSATGLVLPGMIGFPQHVLATILDDGANTGLWSKAGTGHGSGNWTQATTSISSAAEIAAAIAAVAAQEMTSVGAVDAAGAAQIAAIAAAVAGPNGTLQRWLDLGGSASSTAQAVMRTVENRLRTCGLLPYLVLFGIPFGTNVASARIPFYVAPGCGGLSSLTGTLASFTEANGLVLSGTTGLATGITPQSAGLGQYEMGLMVYLFDNPNADTGYSIGGTANTWGFKPFAGTTSFATSNLITFDSHCRVLGDPRIDHIDGLVANATFVATGAMAGVRTSSGGGYVMRDGVSLQGGTTFDPAGDSASTFPTDAFVIRANVAALGAYAITRGMPEAKMAMLQWITDEANIGLARGANKGAL